MVCADIDLHSGICTKTHYTTLLQRSYFEKYSLQKSYISFTAVIDLLFLGGRGMLPTSMLLPAGTVIILIDGRWSLVRQNRPVRAEAEQGIDISILSIC